MSFDRRRQVHLGGRPDGHRGNAGSRLLRLRAASRVVERGAGILAGPDTVVTAVGGDGYGASVTEGEAL